MSNIVEVGPFGALIEADSPRDSVGDLPTDYLTDTVYKHKVVTLRGFRELDEDSYTSFCRSLGELMEWNFGVLLNVRLEENPANHIFSTGRVELHWDGAYTEKTPRINAFQCVATSESEAGGETLFCNTVGIVADATDDERDAWSRIRMTYQTEKKAHYGGSIHVDLLETHPFTGEKVLRFIEPYNEDNMEVNPVTFSVEGLNNGMTDRDFAGSIVSKIYDEKYLYRHKWKKGDFMLIDNNAILHGRAKVRGNIVRHLQRIHIL